MKTSLTTRLASLAASFTITISIFSMFAEHYFPAARAQAPQVAAVTR